MTPITRLEKFLNGIVYGGAVPEPPITRIETMLNDIKNGDVVSLTPITREETFLAKISGANVEIPTPITRIEMFLAKICGVEIATPSPIVRIEHWLNEWASGEDPLGTFTGAIARFFSRASKPIVKIEANFTPIQDLGGQEAPWPPGGGKNKLETTLTTETSRGITATVNADGSIVLSGTNDGTIYSSFKVNAGFQTENGVEYILSGGVSANIFLRDVAASKNDTGSGVTITGDGSAHEIDIRILANTAITGTVVIKPMIRLASVTDDTFAPYSNICPISGHTGCDVVRTGKNLANMFNDGKVPSVTTGALVNANGYRSDFIPFKANAAFSFHVTSATIYIMFYDENKNFLSYLGNSGGTISNTSPANTAFVMLRKDNNNAPVNAQLEYGTASDYEPYQGETVAISFGTTVYGCELTVNEDGSGQAVADMALVDMGTLSWQIRESLGGFSAAVAPLPKERFIAISSCYPYGGAYSDTPDKSFGYVYNNQLFIRDSSYSDAASLKTALNGQSACYELATPVTIPLTASQINTLVGENVVWVEGSSGNITVQAYGSPIT